MSYNAVIIAFLFIAMIIAKLGNLVRNYVKNYEISMCSLHNNISITGEAEYLPQLAHHIFWTGGRISSFRIFQVVISMRRYVQPIYIQMETTDRHNINNIREADYIKMENIIKQIGDKYPDLLYLIRPVIVVKNIHNYDKKKLIDIFSNDYIYPIEYPTHKEDYGTLFSNPNIKHVNSLLTEKDQLIAMYV